MKRLLILAGIFVMFAVGYGGIALAYPAGGVAGRGEHRGYFGNVYDTSTTAVFDHIYQGNTESMPNTINSATEFINFIKYTKLDIDGNNFNTTPSDKVGAAVIIQSMIGTARNNPPNSAQIAEWESRVRYAESQGWINWRSRHSYSINSGNQLRNGGPNDVAWWDESGTEDAMVFRNAAGQVVYAIKWRCANPVGNIRPLQDPPPPVDFNITGTSEVQSNPNPLPGEFVHFRHIIRNTGPTSTSPTHIWWTTFNSSTGARIAGPTDAGILPVGSPRSVGPEAYRVPVGTPAGTQICRQVGWDPVNESGTRNGLSVPACATVRYDFALTPIINFTVNGAAPAGSLAEQGDSIQFTYAVQNSGLTQSMTTNCNLYGLTRTGSYSVPTPHDSASDPGYVPPPTGCPRVFPLNSTTTLNTETITATTANRTTCRALWVNPATAAGASRSAEVCIRIVAKPYLKVYGGDVAAGSGFETAPDTCTNNSNAAITSWNKRAPGTYAGAGVQYAGYALRAITDFATGRGYVPANATPSWLSFANTATNFGTGNFGGNLGSVPCIPDYYGRRPSGTSAIPPNVSAMTTGAYGASGTVNLAGGNVAAGERITVYIDGNVFINSNITYVPNWNYDSIPLFQLVVRGNIYIGSGVTRLDGVYSAQRSGASGGTIYTCSSAAVIPTLTNGVFYNACNSRLTVNGAFVANSIEFLRTAGSLSQSVAGEASATSTAGEVFNFNPSLWMVQPPVSEGQAGGYDAITSLPPVL